MPVLVVWRQRVHQGQMLSGICALDNVLGKLLKEKWSWQELNQQAVKKLLVFVLYLSTTRAFQAIQLNVQIMNS